MLADLCLRARSLRFFYTDSGALPRSLLALRYPLTSQLSIHTLFGGAWWIGLLFALAALAALALLTGYRTRLAAVCSFLLLVSLHARNPIVLNGGDSLLRRTLLWSLFLPLGSGMTLAREPTESSGGDDDRVRDGNDDNYGRYYHPAAVGLLVQPILLYVVNAIIKFRGDAWPSGRAVRMVFSIDALTVFLGEELAEYPTLLEVLGIGWLALLCVSPLLVLATGRRRTLIVGAFVAAHVGMALTLGIGLFPLVSVVALLPLLPPSVWDAVQRRWDPAVERACALEAGIAASATATRVCHVRSRVASGGPFPAVNRVSESFARTFGPVFETGSSAWATARAFVPSGRTVAAVLLTVVLLWNGAALGAVSLPQSDELGISPSETRWDMFAPSPPTNDVWYVAAGTLASGERVDVIRGGDVRWTRPERLGTSYPSARWRKYLEEVRWGDDDRLRNRFVSGLCTRWNARHDGDRRLRALTLYTVSEPTRLDGPEPSSREAVATRECGEHGA
ncbi:HTTM domain-containing protein [Halobaculum sp. CBA1158]|uniref:HTTM domain-containing protein n=1 Tax=Halobaculum sp. CBA1158 TaxID=2904243 RepID=UPI001F2B34E7|nr:HTTM domain-containing protein [Halobaculum sp. CBA1158]UIO98704.1 HTTM domain-containing protein [Halobaculum sp. CBA1158]